MEVLGLVHSLRAARPESLLELIQNWHFSPADLPERAFGAYPLEAEDVEPFLKSAGVLVAPTVAARRMTERLIALGAAMNETLLALNILDAWRHCHDLILAEPGHG